MRAPRMQVIPALSAALAAAALLVTTPGTAQDSGSLLDAMDGLDEDADIVFLLTTNRAEALEKALAQRPGRVDLAVEVPLPDETARARLVRLYGPTLELGDAAVAQVARESAGTTASYAKELVRRTVLNAALAGHAPGDADLVAANAELQSDTEALTRSLLGSGAAHHD